MDQKEILDLDLNEALEAIYKQEVLLELKKLGVLNG